METKPRRNVFWLGIVSLLEDSGSQMIYPLFPVFVTSVLGAPATALGLIEGVAESTASLLRPVAGRLSDRFGKRKIFAVSGYAIGGIAKPMLALTRHWGAFLALRFADRLGKAARTAPRDALIADSADEGRLGTAFGFHRAMDTTGAVIGPLLATALLPAFGGDIRKVLLLAGIPAIAAAVVLAVRVREIAPGGGGEARGAGAAAAGAGAGVAAGAGAAAAGGRGGGSHDAAAAGRARLPGKFWALAAILAVFALGNSSDTFLLLRAKDAGQPLAALPLLYLAFNVAYAAAAFPAGGLSDRIGRRRVLGMGFFVYAAAYAGFAWLPVPALLWLLFPLYGLYYALTDGVLRALAADIVHPSQRGTAYGVLSFVGGAFLLPASLIAGVLWDRVGPQAPFALGAALALVTAIAVLATPVGVQARRS